MGLPGKGVGAERTWRNTKFCDRSEADIQKLFMWDTNDTYFSYNAHALHSCGWWQPIFTCVMSRIFSRQLHLQGFACAALSTLLGYVLCVTEIVHQPGCEWDDWECNEGGAFQSVVSIFAGDIASLARFVGGLFLSLALARTYYSNRGLLGSVFAETLGLSMAASSWIKPRGSPLSEEEIQEGFKMGDIAPRNFKDFSTKQLCDHLKNLGGLRQCTIDILYQHEITGDSFFGLIEKIPRLGLASFGEESKLHRIIEKIESHYDWNTSSTEVMNIRREIIRFSNAGFRMLWLEHIGDDQLVDVEGDNYDILDGLLTPEEWKHIDGIPSRITYVYSWICDLIWQAREKGFIRINNGGKSKRNSNSNLNALSCACSLVQLINDVDKQNGVRNTFAGYIGFMDTARQLGYNQKDIERLLHGNLAQDNATEEPKKKAMEVTKASMEINEVEVSRIPGIELALD